MSTPSTEELRDLQQAYLQSTRETIDVLRHHVESLPRKDQFKTSFPVLLYLAHQLKGSGGTLGFNRISDEATALARELERFLDDGSARPAPEELSTEASGILDRLQEAVQEGEQMLNG